MQQLGDEQLFPELAADEIPVEEGVLEYKPKGQYEFALEDGVVAPDRNGENDHGDRGRNGTGDPELEDTLE